jgi:hypothetical protein
VLRRGEHYVPFYKCPECRTSTFISWDRRPVNFQLDRLSRAEEGYAQRYAECAAAAKLAITTHLPGVHGRRVNLASLSQAKRAATALDTYNKLLPILTEAALQGKSHVIIDDGATVASMEIVLDYLAAFLFENNNVYQVLVNSSYGEAQILFTKEGAKHKSYTNDAYAAPRRALVVQQEEATSGSMSSPVSTSSAPPASASSVASGVSGESASSAATLTRRRATVRV